MKKGDTKNYLTMISDLIRENRHSYAMFQCVCGNIKKIRIDCVERETTKSCGCIKFPRNVVIKHGEAVGYKRSRLLRIYSKMKDRCYDPNYSEAQYYSERGITICDEWKNDFIKFKEWALNNGYADNLSIDRIDVNKGYSPDNCRWATAKEQSRNRRNNLLIKYNGEEKILVEWCEELNLPYSTIEARFLRGWDIKKAFETPIRQINKK